MFSAQGKIPLRSMILLVTALLALAVPCSGKAADKRIELNPTTSWHVSWEAESCLAQRAFGNETDKSAIVIEQFGPAAIFQLLIVSKELRGLNENARLTISYGEGRSQVIERPLMGANKEKVPTIFVPSAAVRGFGASNFHNTDSLEQAERATESIELSWRGKTLLLKTGSLGPLFAEIRKCAFDMFRVWKLDPDEQRGLSAYATPLTSPAYWLRSRDYPTRQLMAGMQSMTTFVLLVGADGVPTDCRISRSYGDEAFKKRTCDTLMRRARFSPAYNAKSEPVPSAYVSTVSWIIPD